MGDILMNGIKYAGGISYYFNRVIYSDKEQRIGIWRDNKPLYQKTIDCGTCPDNATKAIPHGISNIDKIVSFNGMGYNGSNFYHIPSVNRLQVGYQIQIDANLTNVNIYTATNLFVGVHVYITIQYTKTTDVAGSGDWNTDGAPMHHYLTTEHVIGTWIDGSTLYEKTIEFSITSTLGSGFNTIEAMPNIIPIDMKGHLLNLNDGRVYPLNYSNSTATSSLFYYQGNITLNIQNDSWGTGYKLWVTVQYIKTA